MVVHLPFWGDGLHVAKAAREIVYDAFKPLPPGASVEFNWVFDGPYLSLVGYPVSPYGA